MLAADVSSKDAPELAFVQSDDMIEKSRRKVPMSRFTNGVCSRCDEKVRPRPSRHRLPSTISAHFFAPACGVLPLAYEAAHARGYRAS
jgi:hypothetical protein